MKKKHLLRSNVIRDMPALRRFTLALACLVLAFSACRGEAPAGSARNAPVVLITIDTLRSDHLPLYGYSGVETPNLDRFAKDAVLYERAYSHSPLTLPSHASLFTALLPADHGIRDNLGFKLRDDVPTLAERLKAAGYATGGAVSAWVLRRETGIARGFDWYDDDVTIDPGALSLGSFQRSGRESAKLAWQWLEKEKTRPFFLWLHLYEPHTPYRPPEPWLSRYPQSRYDGEIAEADAIVGELLEKLRSAGLYEQSMVIITSDHGEGLGDHGEDEHGIFLYREAIQVPLLVKYPDGTGAGTREGAAVQLADLMPTILETVAVDPISTTVGRPLREIANDTPRAIYSESLYPRVHFGWSELHSLIRDGMHYIHAPLPEIYDLRKDPQERRNIIDDRRRDALAMRREIEPLIREPEAPAAVNPEEAAKLAALGYVGSAVAAAGEELPDPKTRIDSLGDLKLGFRLAQDERWDEAVPLLRRLASENPRMLDVRDLLARSLARVGRFGEAVEVAKDALRLAPTTTHLQIMVASLSFELGRYEDAAAHADLALASDESQAREILARVALERGNVRQAEMEARAMLATGRASVPAWLTLARVAIRKGEMREALSMLDRAAEEAKKSAVEEPQSLHFLRGDALARMGRAGEAEREFLREIELHPREPQPYKNLALLYATSGRTRDARDLLFRLERNAPNPRSYAAIVQVLEILGDDRGVRFWTRRGLQRFPDDPVLRAL